MAEDSVFGGSTVRLVLAERPLPSLEEVPSVAERKVVIQGEVAPVYVVVTPLANAPPYLDAYFATFSMWVQLLERVEGSDGAPQVSFSCVVSSTYAETGSGSTLEDDRIGRAVTSENRGVRIATGEYVYRIDMMFGATPPPAADGRSRPCRAAG
jgi:hypothetical protein